MAAGRAQRREYLLPVPGSVTPAGALWDARCNQTPVASVRKKMVTIKRLPFYCVILPFVCMGLYGDEIPARTVQPEYFIRGLCAAAHSISFDNQEHMWVGSLGDKPPDVHQPGPKKIYRITTDKRVDVAAEVQCTYTTAVAVDAGGQLYVACEGPNKIVRISKDGTQHEIAADGTYRFTFDGGGNLVYGSNGRTFRVTPPGEKTVLFEAAGLWDERARCLFQHTYGGSSITRRDINEGHEAGPETLVAGGLAFVKGLALSPDGELWMLGYDDGNYIAKVRQGGLAERIKLDLSIPSHGMDVRHALNSMTFGKGDFGAKTVYILTWSGDILRLAL
jgi:hypothetical protein